MKKTKAEHLKEYDILRAYLLELATVYSYKACIDYDSETKEFILRELNWDLTTARELKGIFKKIKNYLKREYKAMCLINKTEPKEIEDENIYSEILYKNCPTAQFSII